MKMLESLKRLRYHIGYYRLTKRFQKLDLPQLTKGEKALIRETWPGVHIYEMDFVHVRIYKKIHGFSPYLFESTFVSFLHNMLVRRFSSCTKIKSFPYIFCKSSGPQLLPTAIPNTVENFLTCFIASIVSAIPSEPLYL